MRSLPLLAALLALSCGQAPAQRNQAAPQPATPPATEAQAQIELMDQIERQVRLPEGASPLATYARFYAWQQRGDAIRKVVATYVALGEPPGRRWVEETDFPLIMDGGCSVITMSYNVTTQQVEHVSCNGEG